MSDQLTEILERVTRLESRLVQLGDYVGANLRSKQRIEIKLRHGIPVVEIDALDVSLSRIRKELEQQLPERKTYTDVFWQDRHVMRVYP